MSFFDNGDTHLFGSHWQSLHSVRFKMFFVCTCWHFVNPDQALLQIHLPCRAPFCPRQGKPWPEPLSGTSMGWMCSQSCYPWQSGSSQGHRSPYPPPPMNMAHGSLLQAWALTYRSDRSSSALSVGGDGHYPPAWSFRLWWILEHSVLQRQHLAFTQEALNERNFYGLWSIFICVQHTHNYQYLLLLLYFCADYCWVI